MHDRPILFTASNVRAILEDRKTQTRRVLKIRGVDGGQYPITSPAEEMLRFDDGTFHYRSTGALSGPYPCPYGAEGQRLWVRETAWLPPSVSVRDLREGADTWPKCIYSADADDYDLEFVRAWRWKQRPSIHMPRWASRITLEITDVRVQRVQDISEEDALAEGCRSQIKHSAAFADLWDSINESRGFGWNANPYVWALTFRRVEQSR